MESVLANASGTVRRVTQAGRDYLVAPVSMLIHGVLHGSQGPLYYPEDESRSTINAWDGMPLTVNHPYDPESGNALSANDDGVAERQRIGDVRKPAWNGKSRAEAWFDVQLTRQKAPTVYDDLLANRPIELSTGLYTDNDPTPGTFNGQPYVAVARNHRPDHLAILVGQQGACSRNDGCGVLVNSNHRDTKQSIWHRLGAMLGITANEELEHDEEGQFTASKGKQKKEKKEDAVSSDGAEAAAKIAALRNAGVGQPRHGDSGKYLPHGSGSGKGDVHEAAKRGHKGECPDCGKPNDECDCQSADAAVKNCGGEGGTPGPCPQADRIKSLASPHGTKDISHAEIDAAVNDLNSLSKDDLHAALVHAYGQEYADTLKTVSRGSKKRLIEEVRTSIKDMKETHDFNKGFHAGETRNQLETDMPTRQQMVQHLTTNCSCWKNKDDDKILNALPDANLVALYDQQVAHAPVLEAVKTGFGDLTVNTVGAIGKAARVFNAMDDEDDQGGKSSETEPLAKKKNPFAKKTDNAAQPITERLTHEEQRVWNTAVRIERSERERLVGQLTRYVQDQATKQRLTANFLKKDVGELQDLLLAQGPTDNAQQQDHYTEQRPMFAGMGGGPLNTFVENADMDAPLDIEQARKSYDPAVTNKKTA